MFHHQPVLVEEVVAGLKVRAGGVYVDGTVGGGGHAEALLSRMAGHGRLIGVDRDPEILQKAAERLKPFGERVTLIHGNYDDLATPLGKLGTEKVDGLLLDLGVSSFQLDCPERGFSLVREGALDMRMDPHETVTAGELVHRLSERELAELLRKGGEERMARRIARRLVREREKRRIETTTELAELVARVVPFRRKKIHPATLTFQALRIAVNRELDSLQSFLQTFPNFLVSGGRLVVLSYHSLEDRLVKESGKFHARNEVVKIVTKKPVVPSEEEIAANPRARSAKMRILERL